MSTAELLSVGAISSLVAWSVSACAKPSPQPAVPAPIEEPAIETPAPIETTTPPIETPAPRDEIQWTQAQLEELSLEIMADLERLRGEKFLRPVAVKVSTKAELVQYIKQREAKTETTEKLAADAMIGKMLGVVPHELDLRAKVHELLEAQVGGFYDPDADSFSLMETLPVPLTKITLAHELDHALDDQLFDIDGTLERLGKDSDAIYAYWAVVEGSGTAMMMQWMRDAKDGLDMSSLSEKQFQDLSSMAGSPDWLWKPMMAVYSAGASFLAKTDSLLAAMAQPLEGSAVRAAFTDPPRSTEQVLHPEKYWDEDARDEPRRITVDAAKLRSGWTVLREDTLGELLIAIVTTPRAGGDEIDFANPMAMLGIEFTNEVSSGWGGDRLVLAGKGDARVLVWLTVWDSTRDAGEFFGAMHQQMPGLVAAAEALSGSEDPNFGASLDYGEDEDAVVVTVRVRASRSDANRVTRGLEFTLDG